MRPRMPNIQAHKVKAVKTTIPPTDFHDLKRFFSKEATVSLRIRRKKTENMVTATTKKKIGQRYAGSPNIIFKVVSPYPIQLNMDALRCLKKYSK